MFKCRSCPNLAELVKKANSSSSSGASASSSSGNSSSSSTSNRRAGRVKRQVSCSALLVPVDIPVVDMWDTARQSITHELQVESALHVSAVQRFECLQRHYSGSADDSVATAMLTAPDVAHHSSSLVTITAAAAVPEVAACYATPSEGVEQLRNAAEELAIGKGAKEVSAAASTTQRNTLVTRLANAEAISPSCQRTAASFELLSAEMEAAMDAARRRRKRAARRTMISLLRSSKWLLEKMPAAASLDSALRAGGAFQEVVSG
ncbi:hypothetical protein OEZ86_006946 [Tetradesmus obliquus]|nr:hypothetical protein OEZ86_006946 [Tetradesmus obliquus]